MDSEVVPPWAVRVKLIVTVGGSARVGCEQVKEHELTATVLVSINEALFEEIPSVGLPGQANIIWSSLLLVIVMELTALELGIHEVGELTVFA